MKTPEITALCLVAVMVAMTVHGRPVTVHGTGSMGSTNATRGKTIVANTATCVRASHAIEAPGTPVVPLQNVSHSEQPATSVHPSSLTEASNRTENQRATAPPLATQSRKNYAVSARVLVSGQAARARGMQGGNPGFADLVGAETNAVEFLGYRDYRLVKSERGLVGQNDAYTLAVDTTGSVVVKPLYEAGRKIRTEITWRMPGQADLTTKIFIHRDRPVVIGGPKIKGGGIYLLSLTIK